MVYLFAGLHLGGNYFHCVCRCASRAGLVMYVRMTALGIETWHAYARVFASMWYDYYFLYREGNARDRRFALLCKLRGVLAFDRITRKMRDHDYVV